MITPNDLHPDKQIEIRNYPKGLEAMGKIERPHLGMRMYAVDQRTRECQQVELKTVTFKPVRTVKKIRGVEQMVAENLHAEVRFDAGKWYCWAINEKNAVRKYFKALRAAMR